MATLEIEVDGPLNENLFLLPIQTVVRGRMAAHRNKNRGFSRVVDSGQIPAEIPGQRVSLDTETGEAAIVEGIYDCEQAKALIADKWRLPPMHKALGKVHVPTFLHLMKQAVDAKLARVTKGELPTKIEGTPKLSCFADDSPKTSDKLADSIDRQTAAMTAMAAAFTALANKLNK